MGIGFRQGGWNFDSLVRAVRRASGGPYRLLGVGDRVRVKRILAPLATTGDGPENHWKLAHVSNRTRCVLCQSEAIAVAICDLLARMREEVIENAA